jgi:hypothetical protein
VVVTQNGTETRLFRNRNGRPGLRVVLKGPAGNPLGIGAKIRLLFGERTGPVRELHAGSGYWSQDGATQVMGALETPSQVRVDWPGGATTTAAIPPGSREISIDESGKLEKLR